MLQFLTDEDQEGEKCNILTFHFTILDIPLCKQQHIVSVQGSQLTSKRGWDLALPSARTSSPMILAGRGTDEADRSQ